ncbi:MAG: LssY C-terminal domain-containing protein [Pirellulales bacterium]|jgi:hypothetical protein
MTPRDFAPRNVVRAAVVLMTLFHGLVGYPPHGWAQGPAAAEASPGPQRMIAAHPALAQVPRRTRTVRGHVGDPINVAFIGSDREFHHALARAGWYAADPITLETSVRIAADVVLRKPYPHAPVSDLYVWGRKQDLAFEQPVGNSPKQRHHVRFWRSAAVDERGEPLWLGAATFDERVELSRTTGGVTHKIAPAVDRERDKLLGDTNAVGLLDGYYWVDRFHAELRGVNGGGDPFHTDGRLAVGVITLTR